MTPDSDELVRRLRDTRLHSDMWWVGLCEDAADRIEQLTARLEEAKTLLHYFAVEDLYDGDKLERAFKFLGLDSALAKSPDAEGKK